MVTSRLAPSAPTASPEVEVARRSSSLDAAPPAPYVLTGLPNSVRNVGRWPVRPGRPTARCGNVPRSGDHSKATSVRTGRGSLMRTVGLLAGLLVLGVAVPTTTATATATGEETS